MTSSASAANEQLEDFGPIIKMHKESEEWVPALYLLAYWNPSIIYWHLSHAG